MFYTLQVCEFKTNQFPVLPLVPPQYPFPGPTVFHCLLILLWRASLWWTSQASKIRVRRCGKGWKTSFPRDAGNGRMRRIDPTSRRCRVFFIPEWVKSVSISRSSQVWNGALWCLISLPVPRVMQLLLYDTQVRTLNSPSFFPFILQFLSWATEEMRKYAWQLKKKEH